MADPTLAGYRIEDDLYCPPCSPTNCQEFSILGTVVGAECSICGEPLTAPGEIKCFGCNEPIEDGEEVWIDSKGRASTGDDSSPFHVGCAPAQHGRRCCCPECVEAYLEDRRDGSRGEA